MEHRVARASEILERLVAFETLSGRGNLDLVGYVESHLGSFGVESHISGDESGERANLHALIGPRVDGGVLLNGHTDVVPADGQVWSSNPFRLDERGGRLYGRGAVDMKGFLACMLASVPDWCSRALKRPIHVSMCFDEEIGGFGAPILVEDLARTAPRPAIAIIGEPTGMRIVTGHKGAFEMRAVITGQDAHASDPRNGSNAAVLAAALVSYLDRKAAELGATPMLDSPYDPPFSTINVGVIRGGVARNVVAGRCFVDWELRWVPGVDGDAILEEISRHLLGPLLEACRERHPGVDMRLVTMARVPPLQHRAAAAAAAYVAEVAGLSSTEVASFGTDAGHFVAGGLSTVVFGPGSIEQAHRPDEYIEKAALADCLTFFDRLGGRLTAA